MRQKKKQEQGVEKKNEFLLIPGPECGPLELGQDM